MKHACANGETLFTAERFGNRIHRIDLDTQTIEWKFQAAPDKNARGGSIHADSRRVFVGMTRGEGLYAVDQETGAERWQHSDV